MTRKSPSRGWRCAANRATVASVALIRLVLVDDQALFVEAMRARLDTEPDMVVVGMARSAAVALAEVERHRPDVVLVDDGLGPEDGLALAARLRDVAPYAHPVVVTDHGDDRTAVEALRSGADGVVDKAGRSTDMIDVVRAVHAGQIAVPAEVLSGVLRLLLARGVAEDDSMQGLTELTPREFEVLQQMVAGHDRQQIAKDLYISVNTVHTHIRRILAKLQVHSQLEAVSAAIRSGMRPPP